MSGMFFMWLKMCSMCLRCFTSSTTNWTFHTSCLGCPECTGRCEACVSDASYLLPQTGHSIHYVCDALCVLEDVKHVFQIKLIYSWTMRKHTTYQSLWHKWTPGLLFPSASPLVCQISPSDDEGAVSLSSQYIIPSIHSAKTRNLNIWIWSFMITQIFDNHPRKSAGCL